MNDKDEKNMESFKTQLPAEGQSDPKEPIETEAIQNDQASLIWRTTDSTEEPIQTVTKELPIHKEDQASRLPATKTHESAVPQKIGRFSIRKQLGKGGFGVVYLGFDEQLRREVAIKLTFGSKVGPKAAKLFLKEAQILADLDHSNIIPVFDVGTNEQDDIFIVSKLIDGTDLATRINKDRPSRKLSLDIIIAIADALQHAHSRGLIHRDIKPANILLDKNDKPYLADFGLALRETELAKVGEISGTIAYMSPEQAGGEGHRIDNRSDIYSLGVVLFELLTGRRPFKGVNTKELLSQVKIGLVKTPRMFDPTIPLEIDRICLKALSRHPSDRYAIAKDFADEIRGVSQTLQNNEGLSLVYGSNSNPTSDRSPIVSSDRRPSDSPSAKESRPTNPNKDLEIVPRGLRSFDASDSDFFLELLPGPFDKDGLPQSIRFWKTRIEETDVERSFRVGLVYGPSGCGKTSLMKAGILTRLSAKIEPIYIEATSEDTHGRLLKKILKRSPDLPATNLAETLSLIRRRKLVPSGGKLLLVIDQFEQWLYAQDNYANSELTDALRQCDGETIQAIVMVRDDFWISVGRFRRELDIPDFGCENSAMVDLFGLDHAINVLSHFGAAFGRIPKDRSHWSDDQKQFIDQAVKGLSENSKVISVRLALFSEMVKVKPWIPKTISDMGGVSGVGETFLEEAFGQKNAPIQYRQHQEAVRKFLAALLPPPGTEIKGTKQTLMKLQEVCGYSDKPKEFSDLVKVLNNDLRLITPVDDGKTVVSYQLAHDYLVVSLREWLTRKQRETKKGRAELKLAERAAIWGANQENKQLPTLWEWLQIRKWTEVNKWTEPESKLMAKSSRFHGAHIGTACVLSALLIASAIGVKSWNDQRVKENAQNTLVALLQSADIDRVRVELGNVSKHRPGIDAKIDQAIEDTSVDSEERLKLNLALLGRSQKALDYVAKKLPEAEYKQVPVLVGELQPYADQFKEKYWSITEDKNAKSLLQVASALAHWDPKSERWNGISSTVVDQLVRENPLRLLTWIETMRPAKGHLLLRLQGFALNRVVSATPNEKDLAIELLDAYVDDFETMHELIICGEPKVFSKFFSKYQAYRKQATEKLQQKLAEEIPEFDLLYEEDPLRLVEIHKQANAAVALLRLEDPKPVHEFLTVDRDTEALSQFIYRIRGREVSPSLLIKNLDELRVMPAPTDPKKRQQHFYRLYGMILALGEYKLEQLPSADRDRIVKELSAMYAEHPSRTLHSAVGWLLKRWGQDESVRVVAETELGYDATGVREWYVIQVNPPMSFKSLLKGQIKQEESLIDLAAPIYFTMIVYPGGEFKTGDIKPTRRTEKVQGPFAVSDREVTWRQFSAVDDDTHRKGWEAQYQQQLGGRGLSPDDPAFGVNWFEAVNYCRWLTNRKMPGEKNQCYGKRDLFGSTKSLGKGWVSFLNDSEEAWDWPMDPKRGGFRLLTNEEWEYVARGGTETDFSFGTSVGLLDDYAWHSGNSENWFHPVGLLRPSIAGLFDVHGNLLEWVNNTEIGTAFRVARGGGWSTLNLNCGSSPRYGLKPSSRHYDLGFRLALSCPSGIPQTPEADK